MEQPEPTTSKADADLAAALARTLRCPVCLDLLTDPLVAPCGHAACASCARAAIEASPACPTCRAPTDATSLVPCAALQQVRFENETERGRRRSLCIFRHAAELKTGRGHRTSAREEQEAAEKAARARREELPLAIRTSDATVASSQPLEKTTTTTTTGRVPRPVRRQGRARGTLRRRAPP